MDIHDDAVLILIMMQMKTTGLSVGRAFRDDFAELKHSTQSKNETARISISIASIPKTVQELMLSTSVSHGICGD